MRSRPRVPASPCVGVVMTGRSLQLDDDAVSPSASRPPADLILRTPPNWTAVIFFACLGGLHLFIATLAFMHWRIEGMMSLLLGTGFIVISLISWRVRVELAILP